MSGRPVFPRAVARRLPSLLSVSQGSPSSLPKHRWRTVQAFPFFIIFTLCNLVYPIMAVAQTARPRITQAIDESDLVTLRGNVHPLARMENDRGTAPDDLPMDRILLLLRSSPEQEATLQKLLIELRIIHLQWKEFRLFPECHDQSGSATHAAQSSSGVAAQLRETLWTEVG